MQLRDWPRVPRHVAAVIGAGSVFAAVVLASLVLPVESWLRIAGEVLSNAGAVGTAAVLIGFALLATVGFPSSPLMFLAGLLYGASALPVVWATAVLVAAISFEGARYLFGETSRRALARRPRLQRIATAIDEEGWRIVLLVRASGIATFAIQNYAFGCLTRIRLLPFVAATAAGIVPAILVSGTMGIAARAAATSSADYARTGGLIVIALAAFVLVGFAGQRLAQHLRSAS